jgi:hypothetical protein
MCSRLSFGPRVRSRVQWVMAVVGNAAVGDGVAVGAGVGQADHGVGRGEHLVDVVEAAVGVVHQRHVQQRGAVAVAVGQQVVEDVEGLAPWAAARPATLCSGVGS